MVTTRRVAALVVALLAVAAVATVRPGEESRAASPVVTSGTAPTANPVRDRDGGSSNVTFYYSGRTRLERANLATLGRELGSPSVVVTTPKPDSAEAVRTIHELGAKAYLYVQYFWTPSNREYGGIDLSQHPDWAFCGSGRTPVVGRTTVDGEDWQLLDTNERALRNRIRELMVSYRAQGWDGVMFDRGAASTQPAAPIGGVTLWTGRSTCTDQAFRSGATFSDAFVNLLPLAQDAGLQVMVNNGRSPFHERAMRADPRDRDCRESRWDACRILGDIWRGANLILNETPAHVRATHWATDFRANQRSERDSAHGGRTVALLTTADLGGPAGQNPATVYYEWSQVKLFDLPVAVNTGTGTCPPTSSTPCNQYEIYPELASLRLGKPLRPAPDKQRCGAHAPRLCVWSRAYKRGLVAVNVTPHEQRRVRLPLRVTGCRYVYDVANQRPLARNACVTQVTLRMPSWSGRPLRYSKSPF